MSAYKANFLPAIQNYNRVIESFLVKVTATSLNVRKGPGTSYEVTTQIKKDQVFTITEVQGDWGKLKSGAGWIHLGYVVKV